MTYYTLTTPCQARLDIKKSEFLGFAYPITSRDDLLFHVEHLKKSYPDARHVCYGYIIGDPNNTTHAGFDDDGEPSGTAGKPILNVLQHKAIGNCALMVVRYFGGIKLGAGGLTRACSGAAQAVVDAMTLQEFVTFSIICIQTDFANESFVRHSIEHVQGTILRVDYTNFVQLTVKLAKSTIEVLSQKIGFYGTIVHDTQ